MSTTSRGKYYVNKTLEWYRDYELWLAECIEVAYGVWVPEKKRVIYRKKDLWGCDIVAMGNGEMHWVQVKQNENDVSKAVKSLRENIAWFPNTPLVKVFVAWWPKRVPTKRGPQMVEVKRVAGMPGCDEEE